MGTDAIDDDGFRDGEYREVSLRSGQILRLRADQDHQAEVAERIRTLSKSSRLVTSSSLVLVTNWKALRRTNVETAIAIVHEGFSNRHAAIETSKIASNPTTKKE